MELVGSSGGSSSSSSGSEAGSGHSPTHGGWRPRNRRITWDGASRDMSRSRNSRAGAGRRPRTTYHAAAGLAVLTLTSMTQEGACFLPIGPVSSSGGGGSSIGSANSFTSAATTFAHEMHSTTAAAAGNVGRRRRRRSTVDGGFSTADGKSTSSMQMSITGGVIENVVVKVLKLCLANGNSQPRHAQAMVSASIDSRPRDLMKGMLSETRVAGKNWETPMGLTMRTIDLQLKSMMIRLEDVFKKGEINLKGPILGRAVLKLTSLDFGNFIVHPLMESAKLPSGDFVFCRDGVSICPDANTVTFQGVWYDETVTVETSVERLNGPFTVRLTDPARLTDLGIHTLLTELKAFFEDHSLDLDGTDVSIVDLQVKRDTCGSSVAYVTTDVKVNRIPDPRSLKF